MSNKLNKKTYVQLIEEDIAVLNNHLPDVEEREHIEQVLRHSISYYYPVMESFESAYQKAMTENGCNYGGEFARSIFKAGADNLIEQAVSNGQKKHQQGMDFMKFKAIEAYKNTCNFSPDGCCMIKKEAGKCDCDELKFFIDGLA